VVTRNKDLPATFEALRQWELDRRARGLYALTLPVCGGEDTALVRSPVIL
jgi:hypothetical protein